VREFISGSVLHVDDIVFANRDVRRKIIQRRVDLHNARRGRAEIPEHLGHPGITSATG
jgi:hypothetical protein